MSALFATEGIVLSFIKYKETSIITKIYTREFGLKSYIVNGIRTGKNNKIAFFQPLTLLNLVVYNKTTTSLNRISEVHCSVPYQELNSHPIKILLSFFVTEIISKTVREETVNEELFVFIKDSLLTLDVMQESISNFHLVFLSKLSAFLGFVPSSGNQMLEFCETVNFASQDNEVLSKILESEYHDEILMESFTRKKILNLFLKFYALNIDGLEHLNSAKILSEVLVK